MSRTDPTRTATLRRRFLSEIRRRFARVRRAVASLVDTKDAFGLRRRQRGLIQFTRNERFAFLTTDQQRQAFEAWLEAELDREILSPGSTSSWWDEYIQRAYEQGQGRAFDDVRRPGAQDNPEFYRGTREEFLRAAFAQPETREKLQLMTGRVFTDLKGITADMSLKLTRHLVDGLARGENPRVIAARMAKEIDGITKRRAEAIARTEIIRVHSEGQLDSFERLGVTEIGVAAEWSTAGDTRVCELCGSLEGIVMKVSEARGLIPRHVGCRCTWVPANVGESTEGQKRSKSEVSKAIDASVRAELPKRGNRTLAEQKRRTTWSGPDKAISKRRPKFIGDEKPEKPAAPATQPIGPATLADGRQVEFTKHEKGKGRDTVLIEVDPKKLDESWKKDGGFHIPPDQKGQSEIAGRREEFERFLDKREQAGKVEGVQAPLVYWQKDEALGDHVAIDDGRHRTRVLIDKGADKVVVTAPIHDAEKIAKSTGGRIDQIPPLSEKEKREAQQVAAAYVSGDPKKQKEVDELIAKGYRAENVYAVISKTPEGREKWRELDDAIEKVIQQRGTR